MTDKMKGNYDNTYWNGKGKYKAEYETANKYVPSSGRAATMELSLLRVMANYYYDLYNNGLCNRGNRRPPVKVFAMDFEEEILATNAASGRDLRAVLDATKKAAGVLEQPLIDAFERVMDACILVAYRSLTPAQAEVAPIRKVGQR